MMTRDFLFLAVSAAAFAQGARLVIAGVRQWRDRRDFENFPTSKIHAAAMGPVEMCGAAHAQAPVVAPFSRKSCVFARWEVAESAGGAWRVVDKGWAGTSFFIDDRTGRVPVHPEGCDLEGSYSYQITTNGSPHFVPDPGVKAWLEKHPHALWRGDVRFTEWVVPEGKRIFLRGELTPEGVIRSTRGERFLISFYEEGSLLSDARWQVPFRLVIGILLMVAGGFFVVTVLNANLLRTNRP